MIPGSFVRTRTGVAFALANPPLRSGAFRAIRARIQNEPVGAEHIRVRRGPGQAWRTAGSVNEAHPFEWNTGDPAEFDIDWLDRPRPGRLTVRLELDSIAIPPLVWLEFVGVPEPLAVEGS